MPGAVALPTAQKWTELTPLLVTLTVFHLDQPKTVISDFAFFWKLDLFDENLKIFSLTFPIAKPCILNGLCIFFSKCIVHIPTDFNLMFAPELAQNSGNHSNIQKSSKFAEFLMCSRSVPGGCVAGLPEPVLAVLVDSPLLRPNAKWTGQHQFEQVNLNIQSNMNSSFNQTRIQCRMQKVCFLYHCYFLRLYWAQLLHSSAVNCLKNDQKPFGSNGPQ